MTVGEKIKLTRRERKMTQSDLAADAVTRNMISAIESGKATASVSTLEHIASRLGVPTAYLLSKENDLPFFEKKERMAAIKSALESGNYNACISIIMRLGVLDDELYFILAQCYFRLGISSIKNGSLLSADKQLALCKEYCSRTMYDTERFETIIPLYAAIAKNVNSPLLEFEEERFRTSMQNAFDYEFYKYLTLDLNFEFTHFQYRNHIAAKQLIKERKYADALKLLLEIENTKSDFDRNAYLMFCVYADLETCYRQLFDFENAYRIATKRISLMEGFNI